ncbi:MAG: hypothetical protein JWR84_2101 [Caulobacter sp.]|nr:hypothetical protein [Caulobacter sp.]
MKSWKVWLACAGALASAGGLFLLSPRLGAIALILVALGALIAVAYRLL